MAVVVGDQACVKGLFTIKATSPFRFKGGKEHIQADVFLWRCLMVTARPKWVDIMNVGIPAYSQVDGTGGLEYKEHFEQWMKAFRVLGTS